MKKLLLASLAIASLLAGPATGADLRAPLYKAPPPAPAPVWNWTGCYVGGQVGGLWSHKDWTDHTTRASGVTPTYGNSLGGHDADSWLGGVQGGCDYQFAGSGFVVGIQGDHAWTDAKGSNVNLSNPSLIDGTATKSISTVAVRIGYAWDRFLGYVKGGAVFERVEYRVYSTRVPLDVGAAETRPGGMIGVGGEYAFTNVLSGFLEYNYYRGLDREVTFVDNLAVTNVAEIRGGKSVLRAGLNLRFGGWGAL